MADGSTLTDEALLDELQHAAFRYFLQTGNSSNGLVADTSRTNAPVSIAVVGFALSCYPVAVERGWMPRADALQRTLTALRFFHNSDQSGHPEATGYKGFYYHFLDLHTGGRVWRSELSMVDTALLIAGALTASIYFSANTPDEIELRELADSLYRRIDWHWAQNNGSTIMQGWKPDCGFLHYGWEGYNEAIVLYVLALGSPTHPLKDDGYQSWTSTYQWENIYGCDLLYAGPLFVHQFSHAWIDFRGIQDRFMREKRCDYFENSRRAVYMQREYAQRNPRGFAGYDENCWGLSACDGPIDPSDPLKVRRRLFGYAARGAPYGPDDGTIAPSAALASVPFAADLALSAVRHYREHYPDMLREFKLPSGFNPSLPGNGPGGWISQGYFGLDQGIIVLMIENYRSQLIWSLMRDCSDIKRGLRRAGFRGGWL